MAKTSYVLRALSILGPEEILKLSEVSIERQVPLKKAAGEDLIVWNEAPTRKRAPKRESEEAKVLNFPERKSISDFSELEDPNRPKLEEQDADADEKPSLIQSDLMLWQREMSKESGGSLKKVDAVKGYQKSTQMYVVKATTPEGKQKIRFASVDGILVNKKQA